jgi:hypothetical protein
VQAAPARTKRDLAHPALSTSLGTGSFTACRSCSRLWRTADCMSSASSSMPTHRRSDGISIDWLGGVAKLGGIVWLFI